MPCRDEAARWARKERIGAGAARQSGAKRGLVVSMDWPRSSLTHWPPPRTHPPARRPAHGALGQVSPPPRLAVQSFINSLPVHSGRTPRGPRPTSRRQRQKLGSRYGGAARRGGSTRPRKAFRNASPARLQRGANRGPAAPLASPLAAAPRGRADTPPGPLASPLQSECATGAGAVPPYAPPSNLRLLCPGRARHGTAAA